MATPIPNRASWESKMVTQGAIAASQVANGANADARIAGTYYDMMRVMYQIKDYTGNATPWNQNALTARNAYRDEYIRNALKDGNPALGYGYVPGYWNFTTGLRMDYERTGDTISRDAVNQLAIHAAYSTPVTGFNFSADTSREYAYAIVAHHNSKALGFAPIIQAVNPFLGQEKLPVMVNLAYDHIEQWFTKFCWKGQGTAPGTPVGPCTNGLLLQFSPFMVGLTAHALIRDWEVTGDSRCIPALIKAADWLMNGDSDVPTPYWTRSGSNGGGWFYDAVNGGATAITHSTADLNMLIIPMYGFLYLHTGNTAYRDMGNQAFSDGTQFGFIGLPKQFDQNYYWSTDYIKWYEQADGSTPQLISTSTAVVAAGVVSPNNVSATVTVTAGSGTPTGNVTLIMDGNAIGTQALSGGSTIFTINSPSVATHTLTANYAGSGTHASSNGGTSFTVTAPGVATSLIAAYAFEEGSGTTTADYSGNGHTATLVNAGWTASGKYGNGISLNGTDALVSIPNAADLQVTTGFTLEGWVNPTTVNAANRDFIMKYNDNYFLEATSASTSSGNIARVQTNSVDSGTVSSAQLVFTGAVTTGNFIVVGLRVGSLASTPTVTDSLGNTYVSYKSQQNTTDGHTGYIFYAKNVNGGGACTVTANLTASATLRWGIVEYSGVDQSSPVDQTGVSASQDGATAFTTGNMVTTNAKDLLFVVGTAAQSVSFTPGSGYTTVTAAGSKILLEERIVSVTGTYTGSYGTNISTNGTTLLGSFKAATVSGGGGPMVGGTFGGQVQLLQGSSLTAGVFSHIAGTYDGSALKLYVNGALVGTKAVTGNVLTGSNALSFGGDTGFGQYLTGVIDEIRLWNGARTQAEIQADMATPLAATAPANLVFSSIGETGLVLSWDASTGGIAPLIYHVERCDGGACVDFEEIAATPSTSIADSGLVADTLYRYRVRAVGATGNLSAFSTIAEETTEAAPVDPPEVTIDVPTPDLETASPVTPSGTATSVIGISDIDLTINSAGGPLLITFNPGTGAWSASQPITLPGDYTLQVVATDLLGQQTSTTVSFTIITTSTPTIAIIGPADGENVSGNVQISVSTGGSQPPAQITYTIDNSPLAVTIPPSTTMLWSSAGTSVGQHAITATLIDAIGNVAEDTIHVTVLETVTSTGQAGVSGAPSPSNSTALPTTSRSVTTQSFQG